MKYFINYNLGWQETSNKKADLGTMAHKVMEVLAGLKKFQQDKPVNKRLKLEDDTLGKININKDVLLTKDFLHEVADWSFDAYKKKFSHHQWYPADRKEVKKIVDIFTEWNDGQFDPRYRHIHAPEAHFDLPIEEDWAKFDYTVNGERMTGQIGIKGTIDLVTLVNDDTIEVIDWKGLPVETKIPTPEGFSTMGELKVGDTVYDQFGMPCNVVGKSRAKIRACYEILFDDNTYVVCDDEHLWKLSLGMTVPIKELMIGDTINVAKPLAGSGRKADTDARVRTIISIDPKRKMLTQCIAVDSPDNTYLCTENYIPTHNSGRRMDWATGEEKDFKKLQSDPQLLLYFYAMSRLYPDYPNRIMSIFFCKDMNGNYDPKPFSMCLGGMEEDQFMEMMRIKVEKIRDTTIPTLRNPYRSDFKCKNMCHYYKNNWPDSNLNMCEYIEKHVKKNGMSKTIEECSDPNHRLDKYNAPG